MDNKYIMAEDVDFRLKNGKLIYNGNIEDIEYLDINNIIESKKINSINLMFSDLSKKDSIKGIKLNSTKITEAIKTFRDINVKSLDLSEFTLTNAINFGQMFSFSNIKNLDLSNFDTRKVVNFIGMFIDAKIEKLDLSNFFFSRCNLNFMFKNFISKELILPNSFPINFEISQREIFFNSEIEVIKTQNEEFYKKYKEWFKQIGTELILIS